MMPLEAQTDLPQFGAVDRSWARKRAFGLILLTLVVLVSSFVTMITWHQPHKRAVIGMAWGLIRMALK